MATNRINEYHQQWIGYLNPTGLVFSPNALNDAQVVINEGVISEQKEFVTLVTKTINDKNDFVGFENTNDLFFKVLNWRESDLNGSQELISQYSFTHPQFGEVISPSYVAKVNTEEVILIQSLLDEQFDSGSTTEDGWNSSPHFKFERLLREKQVSTGIILSNKKLRLIFAPRGESSGYIDFPFHLMLQPSGRLVFSAFRELLSDAKVFNSAKGQSLIEILKLSRKYQAQVSIELSGQVLAALYELLRGFQSANDEESGKLLELILKENPQLIYEGLLTTLLRMVFIMYAKDRNLLATDSVYQSSYSLAGLYERLRQDEAQNPDTMDSRYGAWAHLIALFRLIYDGAEYESDKGKVVLPARHGHLFDPNIYLFLEGRIANSSQYQKAPKISDGVVFRVLRNLLVLNGERISYRTLDVEQIGSVYETMMGFEIGIADGATIALKPNKSHGAPLPINLDEILNVKDKSKKLGELSELKLSDKVKTEFNASKTIEELERVLDKRIDRRATPFVLSVGAMVLVPSEARRKSGSHYTPRDLTEPIVRVALEPLIKNLGDRPTPEQILDLKICDPAMGSGAFLVETCRQLSEKLVESWATHKVKVSIGGDEDELLHARRIIAQKCLYGVDKNHMAVNLAKHSLWLVTLAKDHSFSFLDHNLKHGDSLVGLTNTQIMSFDYKDRNELPLFQYVKDQLNEALEARDEIINATAEENYDALKLVEGEYLERLEPLRLVGNFALKCFFDGKNEKERANNLQKHSLVISNFLAANDYEKLKQYCQKNLSDSDPRFVPFHWELEFPEVFSRDNAGFDCFVGNPPFAGKNTTINGNIDRYVDWLQTKNTDAHGNSDLVAHFFRSVFQMLRTNGTFGLIATKTIAQGETRVTGLQWIRKNHGRIYSAVRRVVWPGAAAVVVSVVHIVKGDSTTIPILDGFNVNEISSFLVNGSYDDVPPALAENDSKCFIGSYILGMGFTFDDSSEDANPISLMNQLIEDNPKNADRIFPFLGYSEVANHPKHLHHRFVIDFGDMTEEDAQTGWPDLVQILREKVKPERDKKKRDANREKWWQYAEKRPGLYRKIRNLNRVLVAGSQATAHFAFAFLPTGQVYSSNLTVIAVNTYSSFSVIQSRIHEVWSRFFMTTLGDTLVYTPTTCFEHFPFPGNWEDREDLEKVGKEYYEYRASLLEVMNIGLTDLYNEFHSPDNQTENILKLRKLHEEMDKSVLLAFGWSDLDIKYEFILDFEDEPDDDLVSRKRKKPYKFKFVQTLHDEIMSRLLDLNKNKFDEEVRLGLHKR